VDTLFAPDSRVVEPDRRVRVLGLAEDDLVLEEVEDACKRAYTVRPGAARGGGRTAQGSP
jgi:hypothetical protein